MKPAFDPALEERSREAGARRRCDTRYPGLWSAILKQAPDAACDPGTRDLEAGYDWLDTSSFNARRSTLPTLVFGSVSRNSMRLGTL